jgi:hypothetical protein
MRRLTCLPPDHPSVYPKVGGECLALQLRRAQIPGSMPLERLPLPVAAVHPTTPLQTRCRPGTVSPTPKLLMGPRSSLRYPRSLTTQSKKRVAFTLLYPSEPLLASQSHSSIHDCVYLCLISQSTFDGRRRPTQVPMTPSSRAMFATTESVTTTPLRKPCTLLPSEHTNDPRKGRTSHLVHPRNCWFGRRRPAISTSSCQRIDIMAWRGSVRSDVALARLHLGSLTLLHARSGARALNGRKDGSGDYEPDHRLD